MTGVQTCALPIYSLADREKEARKGEVKVKVSKTKPSVEAIKARAKKVVAKADTEVVAE